MSVVPRHARRTLGALLLATTCTALAAPASYAAEDAVTIDLIEPGDEALSVLVSLPPGFTIDPAASTVRLDDVEASTSVDTGATSVRRTAVLAIDTSESMLEDDRLDAAEAAALLFVDQVPAEVELGVVTFDATPSVVLQPTLDRDAARAAVSDLTTDEDTALYDAVAESVALTGAEGQRQVLLISDGEDTVGGDAPAAVALLQDSGVVLDAVALDGSDVDALGALAVASGGSVVQADADDLGGVLAQQATDLTDQVVIGVEVPDGVSGTTAQLDLELVDAAGTTYTASAVAPLGDLAPEGTTTSPVAAPPSDTGFTLPTWALYVGMLVLALGAVALLVLALPRRTAPTPAERVTAYTAAVTSQAPRRGGDQRSAPAEDPLAGAKDAAAQVLHRNRGLEARIAQRLEAAGSALKPAEWLLVHLAAVVVAVLVGALLGGGSILVALVFLALGAVGPWAYLGLRRNRRRKAFDSALPDTLQLMSGALSAGLSLTQACDTIARDGQEPVAGEFRRVLVETRLGVTVDVALADAAERFESKDFRWVVMAIRIQREVGGNLAELLQTVAGTMREREYLRRQVRSLSAEGRLSAIILGSLPPGFMLFQLVANPTYISPLFTDPRGWVLLGAGLLFLGIGAFWMSRMVKVEV